MILMTGGTGFIGRQLLARLIDRRERIRVLVRPQSVARLSSGAEMETIVGDVTDADLVKKGMEGCEVVIHLAALRDRWHLDRSEFEQVNVCGTRLVLEAALAAGVQKVLHVSTALVLGPSQGRPQHEEDQGSLTRFVNEYQRTKFLADLEVRLLLEKGLPVVTLFPSTTYGPSMTRGESPVTDIALAFARGGFVPRIGMGVHRRNLVYVEDVVSGMLLALDRGQPGTGYILGGENVSPLELLTLLEELTGRPVSRWQIPMWMARGVGGLAEAMACVVQRRPPFSRSTIDILSQEWMVSSERAKAELGYRPIPLQEGLRRTLVACLERN